MCEEHERVVGCDERCNDADEGRGVKESAERAGCYGVKKGQIFARGYTRNPF